jgi:glycosyltransferase involved in cell wall biosynthesis
MPRVSVIIPSYNRADLLAETLDSVIAQTYPDWEALVVDDGSEDNSLELAQKYAAKDNRIRASLRRGEKKGACVCRNQGLSMAAGEYVIFLDSDDLLSDTCLEHRVGRMDHKPECGYGVYQTEMFYRQTGDRKILWNIYTETPDLYRFLSKDVVWHTTGPIWRKDVLSKLGGFDETLASFHDWELHVRALIAGIKYFKEPIRDNFYRNGTKALSAISTVSCTSPDHLTSHERMFANTLARLRKAGLLDNEVRSRVAGLFWWLAIRWRTTGHLPDADRIWRKACSLRLCRGHHYLEGRLISRLCRVRGGGRLSLLIQLLLWPRQFYQIGSKHLHNAPAHGTADASLLSTKPRPGVTIELARH